MYTVGDNIIYYCIYVSLNTHQNKIKTRQLRGFLNNYFRYTYDV